MARMDSVPAASAGAWGQGDSCASVIINAEMPTTITAPSTEKTLFLVFMATLCARHRICGAQATACGPGPANHARRRRVTAGRRLSGGLGAGAAGTLFYSPAMDS